jgi:alkanesulfonate monooxygenase SsuD/methylene tetrahydromethanopterin reductase-like flavin-dependent oxidoreductase (luciferase family)
VLKPIIQIYPVLAAEDEDERARLRPIGRNRDRYQEVLEGWHDIVKAADELGFWGVATIEHHFWSEGYEVGPNPGILDAYWTAITRRVRLGQLGYVMSTQNPIRVAEEVAILDHLSRGRCFVGFARGYQARWTNILGQHYGVKATRSPSAAVYNPSAASLGLAAMPRDERDVIADAENRSAFEENIEIVLKAWTQPSISHQGRHWEIPYPYDSGVREWPVGMHPVTARFGAPDEIDQDGAIRSVSVVPAPYTDPYPPVFVSGSGSPETIEYCARKRFVPVYFTGIDVATRLAELYQRTSPEAGRRTRLGQDQCLVRWLEFGDSEDDAWERAAKYDFDIFKHMYGPMGRRVLDTTHLRESISGTGLFAVGSISSVRDQLIDQWQRLPADYMTLIFHYAQMPKDIVIENMALFMQHVKPALDEIIDAAGGEDGEPRQ